VRPDSVNVLGTGAGGEGHGGHVTCWTLGLEANPWRGLPLCRVGGVDLERGGLCVFVCVCLCVCVCVCVCLCLFVCVLCVCMYLRMHVCMHLCSEYADLEHHIKLTARQHGIQRTQLQRVPQPLCFRS
jgi:hypothetical protein